MTTCSECGFATVTQDGDVYCFLYDKGVEWSDCCGDYRPPVDDIDYDEETDG